MKVINIPKLVKMSSMMVSICFMLVGIYIFMYPNGICYQGLCGMLFILFGIIKMFGYVFKDQYQLAFQYDLEFGFILCFIGILMIVIKENSNVLCIVFGLYQVLDSLFKMRITADAKEFGIPSWWLSFSFALICILQGIFLTLHPLERILGASFIMEALMNLSIMITMVKIQKQTLTYSINKRFESEE